jgi:hypothetical protein
MIWSDLYSVGSWSLYYLAFLSWLSEGGLHKHCNIYFWFYVFFVFWFNFGYDLFWFSWGTCPFWTLLSLIRRLKDTLYLLLWFGVHLLDWLAVSLFVGSSNCSYLSLLTLMVQVVFSWLDLALCLCIFLNWIEFSVLYLLPVLAHSASRSLCCAIAWRAT